MKQQTVLNESTSCFPHPYAIPTFFLFLLFAFAFPLEFIPAIISRFVSLPFFSHFIASELASFDWDTFQALLSLLLYLDAFLQLLHRSHHTVISFFSTNRELLLELASGGAIPKEMALSAMDFVLLEMQSKEESWQSSVLTVSRKEKSYSVDGIRDDD